MLPLILVFCACTLITYGLVKLVLLRTPANNNGAPRPLLFRLFHHEIEWIGRHIEVEAESGRNRKVRNMLLAAGVRNVTSTAFRGLQFLLGLCLGVVAAGGVFLFERDPVFVLGCCMLFAIIGWMLPQTWLRRKAEARQEEISRGLPFAIDLSVTAMRAGVDFGAAMQVVAREVPSAPLAEEFNIFIKELQLGATRAEALQNLAHRIQLPELKRIVSSIVQATEMGASISAAMVVQGQEMRRARHHRAEEKAGRAPSLMLFPLAVFIMPAIFIIIITPVVLKMGESGLGF